MLKFQFSLKNTKKIHKFLFNKCFSQKTKLDPYLILEVNRKADWKTIKLAYFKLARLYHPDLNKNDERASKKFLQIKEAYEYFERKYNPEKYANSRQSFSSKFDEERTSEEGKTEEKEKEFESIREKNKKQTKQKTNFEFKHDDKNIFGGENFEASGEYFRDEQLKLDIEKQKNISRFLFTKIPVPRSSKMVDRLGLKSITLGKGRLFGPDDYMGFTLLVIFIVFLYYSRSRAYKSYSFENLENVNIYNALQPSEVVKIYEENEISPTEQMIINSKEHEKYKNEQVQQKILSSTTMSLGLGTINDVPKVDLKKKFKESIQKN